MPQKSKNRYLKVASHEARKGQVKKVVLLYSGGDNTSAMIGWIKTEYKAEIIALIVDIGQQSNGLESLRQKALDLGATKSLIIDARAEFADEYIAPSIKANGMYQGRYYLSVPLGRTLLAKWAVKIAAQEGADAIAHGASGKGNDQVRIEGSALALNPDIKIIAPLREWSVSGNNELEQQTSKNRLYAFDDNMWGAVSEGNDINNSSVIPQLDKILRLCVTPEKAKDAPDYLTIEFSKGLPVSVDGVVLPLVEIIGSLNTRAATHAIGLTHLLEDRIIGLKVRSICEAPAAETIITAHKALERYVSSRLENEFKTIVDEKWAYLVYGGLWFEPLMDDLNAYQNKINSKISGTVTLKLFKGNIETVAIETPNSVFDEKSATFMEDYSLNQNASAGDIEHYSFQMKMAQRRRHTALLAIGGRTQKLKLLSEMKVLDQLDYRLYATYKTYKFLKSHGIEAILVNKLKNPELKPNLAELLDAHRFDLIINIPINEEFSNLKNDEKSDGQIIREKAVITSTPLITSASLAKAMISQLKKIKV